MTDSARAWAALVAVVLSRVYRALLLTLVATAMLPMLWDWTSYLVRTGSMEPSIAVGDVVVAQPVTPSAPVPVGRVMVFDRAGAPAGAEPLVHRVVAQQDDGSFTTAGDANLSNDSAPLLPAQLRGQAAILVPYVGLPLRWLDDGDLVPLLVWSLLTVAAFVLASGRAGSRGSERSSERRSGRHRDLRTSSSRRRRGLVAGALPLVLLVGATGIGLSGIGVTSAEAAFTAKSSTRPNTWTVATGIGQGYTTQVLADDPFIYYRLDEAGGTSMADSSGNAINGTGTAIAGYRQTTGLPRNAGYAIALNANKGRVVAGGAALVNSPSFTVELWFRTSSKLGGKLIGFENSRNETSSSFDRHVLMRPDGRLVYGAWGPSQTVTSPAAYNNGGWHHLVLTSVPLNGRQDVVMYVDGQAVASGAASPTSAYSGWWRVGFGSLGTFPASSGLPSSANFVGSIDNVAGYPVRLSADRVRAHYAAR